MKFKQNWTTFRLHVLLKYHSNDLPNFCLFCFGDPVKKVQKHKQMHVQTANISLDGIKEKAAVTEDLP